MHQNTSFSNQESKNFLGRGHSHLPRPLLRGEKTPLPIPHPHVPPLQLDPGYATESRSDKHKFDQGLSRLLQNELYWLTFLSDCRPSWQWRFTGTFKKKRRSTCSTTASQSPMSPVDSIWDLPVDTS